MANGWKANQSQKWGLTSGVPVILPTATVIDWDHFKDVFPLLETCGYSYLSWFLLSYLNNHFFKILYLFYLLSIKPAIVM